MTGAIRIAKNRRDDVAAGSGMPDHQNAGSIWRWAASGTQAVQDLRMYFRFR